MEAVGINNMPFDMKGKLQLVKKYIYEVELQGFVDVIRSDLLQIGLVLYGEEVLKLAPVATNMFPSPAHLTTIGKNNGTESMNLSLSESSSGVDSDLSSSSSSSSSSNILKSSSSYGWLNYEQFRNLFYFKCDSLLEDQGIDKLKRLINTTAEWSGPLQIVGRLKRYFIAMIDKKVEERDIRWIEQLLRFWTSKAHCVPHYASIVVNFQYFGRPRITASACFNELVLPSYLIEEYRVFEEIMDESVKSLKFGFTTS